MRRFFSIAGSLICGALAALFIQICIGSDSEASLASLLGVFGINVFSSPAVPLLISAAVGIIVTVNMYQIFSNSYHLLFFKIEAIAYCLCVLAVILCKSVGTGGINLYVLDIVEQLKQNPLSITMNVLLFVPIGVVSFILPRRKWSGPVVVLGAILLLEAIQYFACLGVADVVDVLLNMACTMLGFFFCDALRSCGFSFDSAHKNVRHIVRIERNITPYGTTMFIFTGATCLILVVALCLALLIPHSAYEDAFETGEELLTEPTSDLLLNTLPERIGLGLTYKEAKQVKNALLTSMVNGKSSKNTWLEINKDGTFSVQGQITQYDTVKQEDGSVVTLALITAEESYDGVSVTHSVPIIFTDETRLLSEDGRESGFLSKNSQDYLEFYIAGGLNATFQLEEGWLKAISVQAADDYSIVEGATVDLSSLGMSTEKAKYQDTDNPWLEINTNNVKNASYVRGYIDSLSNFQQEATSAIVACPDFLGSALILHSISADCNPTIEMDGEIKKYSLTYEGGNLTIVE